MRLLERQEIEDIARGSAVLGTGGGGDPYLGQLAAIQAIRTYGPLQLATLDELPDDILVAFPFAIGSPVPFLERITLSRELVTAYEAMSRFFGQPIGAVMSIEIGGINSVLPIAIGRELGLPVIDGDCMGRAYPEIQLVTLTLYGHSAAPLVVADEHGNVAIIDTINNTWAERLARPVAVEMGAIAGGFGYPITVKDLREAAILGTVSFAERIGEAIRLAQTAHRDPITAVLETAGGFRLFSGRIIDVERRTQRGWALGETRIAGLDDFSGREMVIRFQNEHLVAMEDGEIVVSVPDLIAILDTERGEPITTENLRYGFRVTIIGIPCDLKWRTPEGIALGGPRHFGYDIDFTPVEERFRPELQAGVGMSQRLTLSDLPDLGRGAAFLGTGGGGNPYVGRLMVEDAMRDAGGDLELLDLADVPEDGLIIPTAMMGAPTCIVEKLPRGTEAAASLRLLEERLGRKAFATMPIEAGGVNSMIPLVVALRLGIPVVDGDGMGRAFPELQHETFNVYGVSGTPMAITNDHHDQVIIDTHDNLMAEWLARGVTIRMGGVAYIAEYAMDGATAKRVSIAGTIGVGLKIGRALRYAREHHLDPFDHLIATLAETSYFPAKVIFTGKIVEVFRRTAEGFAKGTVRIRELDGDEDEEPRLLEIDFQNENLIARVGDRILSVVPDLICILDSETAEPITTEELRYGQRVKVMAVTVPEIMRTPEALEVWGPRTFGFDVDYVPMAGA